MFVSTPVTPPTPEGTISFSPILTCLLFGAGTVIFSGFIKASFYSEHLLSVWKALSETVKNNGADLHSGRAEGNCVR